MNTVAPRDARLWRRGFLAAVAVLVLTLASLAPYATDSAELVRMRNALVLDDVDTQRFDWTPATVPADFAVESAQPTPAFKARVDAMHLGSLRSDWDRALHIARHLLSGRTRTVGNPIQSDLERTYQVIVSTGEGYCGDYADVFTALAIAGGLNVRSWAFSFDGFGGNGHIFNEVWDAGSGKWRLIDAFNNYYMTGPDGDPMSALEFRAAMLRDPRSVTLVPIEPAALPVYKYEEKAREFYVRGLRQWFLWWGNSVYTYEQAPLVRAFGGVSRSLEQLGGIAQQVFPHIRIVPDEANRAPMRAMHRLRLHLLVALAVVLIASASAIVLAFGWWRAVHRRGAST
jgi:transglutaminase-like putative cysteine protease